MAGFKKKLPMSAALRQGGEGTIPPPKAGGGPPKAKPTLGVSPKVSAGIPKLPTVGKMPKFK